MRDDFLAADKEVLAKRVGFRCSNLKCRKLTAGPQADTLKAVNIGVAAHITAAAPGGPRFESALSAKERASIENGIWLCQSCAKLIDNDPIRFTAAELRQWKLVAEEKTLIEIESSGSIFPSLEPDAREEQLSRVLIPEVAVATTFRTANSYGTSLDYSVYPFVVEELMSVGVCSMAVVRGTSSSLALPLLPDFLRERVCVIEPSAHAYKIQRLFSSVEEELDWQLEFADIPILCLKVERYQEDGERSRKIMHACAELYPIVFKLVLGMQYGLHVEINMEKALTECNYLRKALRSPKARGVFAMLAGVLSSYKSTSLNTIEFSARVLPTEHMRSLARLLDEPDYRLMSRGGYQLGIQDQIGNALRAFTTYSRKLLEESTCRNSLHSTTRSVRTAFVDGFIPFDFGELDPFSLYLPPIITYQDVRRRAQKCWLEARPEPLFPERQNEAVEILESRAL
jgi:hypothetical protein